MGGTTSTYGFPYPAETDTPDGAADVQALAAAVDAELAAEVTALTAQIAALQPVYASAQGVSTTSPSAITGLAVTLPPGTYRLRLHLFGTCSTVTGVTYTITFAYTGGVTAVALNGWNILAGSGGSWVQSAVSMTTLGGGDASPASTGTSYQVETRIEGVITVASGGTLQAEGQSSVSGDAVHVAGSTWMDCVPAA